MQGKELRKVENSSIFLQQTYYSNFDGERILFSSDKCNCDRRIAARERKFSPSVFYERVSFCEKKSCCEKGESESEKLSGLANNRKFVKEFPSLREEIIISLVWQGKIRYEI